MTEQATEKLVVVAPLARCYGVALDFERYPDWAPDIKDCHVLERDDQGRGTKVAFRAAAMGRSASCVLEYRYDAAPSEMSWRLLEGDIMRVYDGVYHFDDVAAGTEITYKLSVELVVPIPGFVKRRAEGKIISTALRELKRRVESLDT